MRRSEVLRQAIWSIAFWIAFGALIGVQFVVGMRAQGMHHPWMRMFTFNVASCFILGVASPLVVAIGTRWSLKRYGTVLLGYLALAAADAVWFILMSALFQPFGDTPAGEALAYAVPTFFYLRFPFDLIAFAGMIAFGHTIESRRRLAEREEQLTQARLDALKRQLEPHFLFNTLNAIAGLVRSRQNETAVSMIAGLSDLLRRVVDGPAGAETTLAEEIEFLDAYLRIQQMRFAGRLHVEVSVPGELSSARVPSMILQPVVENAIKHGIGSSVEGGFIRVSARRSNGCLRMTVENDGPSVAAVHEGVGLGNTRARLKNMYGDAASFELRNNDAGAVEAIVTVPYEARQ